MDREATDELVKSLRCGSVLSTSLTYFALPTYVLLSLLWCVCVICLIVKIEPNMLFCCHMSCCLTSRGTMDWLSQNDSKQSIIYNQAHSKRQNSSQSTPSIKSTDTRGSQSIKSMNSSHIPTVQNLRNPKNLKTKSHPFLAFTCFSLKPKCWFEVKTVCCSRPRQWRSHGSLPAGHVLSMIKTWFVEYCTISTVTLYSIFVTILKEQELAHTSRPDALSDESSWVSLSWLMFSWASLEPKLWAGPQEPPLVMNLHECD